MNILRYLLFIAIAGPSFLFGQNNFIYSGGSDDGIAISYGGTRTNNAVYQGGNDDGLAIGYAETQSQNAIYQGGSDDGFGMEQSASPTNNNIYEGGMDDGFGLSRGGTNTNSNIFNGGHDDGFTQFHLEDAIPLRSPPLLEVEWLAFDAIAVVGKVQLSWETALELNHHVFEIERSKEAALAERIGKPIEGKGSPEQGASYTAVDSNPLEGSSFYRIRAIDKDGHASYTAWKKIWFSGREQLQVIAYPNPVKDFLEIQVHSNSASEASIRLFNVLRKTKQQTTFLLTQQVYKYQLDMRTYTEGIYFIEVTTSDGFKKALHILK